MWNLTEIAFELPWPNGVRLAPGTKFTVSHERKTKSAASVSVAQTGEEAERGENLNLLKDEQRERSNANKLEALVVLA